MRVGGVLGGALGEAFPTKLVGNAGLVRAQETYELPRCVRRNPAMGVLVWGAWPAGVAWGSARGPALAGRLCGAGCGVTLWWRRLRRGGMLVFRLRPDGLFHKPGGCRNGAAGVWVVLRRREIGAAWLLRCALFHARLTCNPACSAIVVCAQPRAT
jgi:hypothetical protein